METIPLDDLEEPDDLDEPEDFDEPPLPLLADFEPPDLLPLDLLALPPDFEAPDLLLDFEEPDLLPPDDPLLELPEELLPLLDEDEDFDAPFPAEDLAAEPDLEEPDDFEAPPFAEEPGLLAPVDLAPELLLLDEADLLELDLLEPLEPEFFVALDDFELDFFDAGIFFLLFSLF